MCAASSRVIVRPRYRYGITRVASLSIGCVSHYSIPRPLIKMSTPLRFSTCPREKHIANASKNYSAELFLPERKECLHFMKREAFSLYVFVSIL